MSDLETFRRETRSWLEANAPKSLFGQAGSELDGTWGGRKATYPNPDSQALARSHGRPRLHGADLAEGVRRRRSRRAAGQGASASCCASSSCRRR